jgi:hypothetical protein
VKVKIPCCLILFLPALLCSCFGFNAEIEINGQGPVTLNLEYRVSLQAENIGRLDGNENMPILPAGRRDFERTAARLGARLKSFSSKEDGADLVNRASLVFDSVEELAAFFGSMGGVSYRAENGHFLSLVLKDPGASDGELTRMVQNMFAGYSAELSLKAPGARAGLEDGAGNGISLPGGIIENGGSARFSAPMGGLLSHSGSVVLVFTWR